MADASRDECSAPRVTLDVQSPALRHAAAPLVSPPEDINTGADEVVAHAKDGPSGTSAGGALLRECERPESRVSASRSCAIEGARTCHAQLRSKSSRQDPPR